VKRETQILARATDRILNGSEAAIVKTLTAAATQIAADLPSAAARGKRADAYVSTRSSMLWRAL
jgi:histidinol dehydrogenase